MSWSSHVPLVIGIVLLIGAAVIIWLRPSENNPLTVMFLTGVALIFLSDQRIQNLKFGTSGVEVSREKFSEAQQDVGEQIAALRVEIEKQKQIVERHQQLIEARATSGDTPSRPSAGPVVAEVKEIKDIKARFSENSKSSILVFFRQGQRTVAEALSAKLVEQGYKSSATATDLTEISVPGIEPRAGLIVIARARQVPVALAKEIASQTSEVAKFYRLPDPIVNNDEWPFRRGHIQIYMF